jgi:hypothetical protein
MKTKIFTTLALLAMAFSLIAQAPQIINYQAVVRNDSGELITNQNVSLRFSILPGSPDNESVYTETHTAITNDNGLINIQIGAGEVESGVFETITWESGPYFMKVEMDENGGITYQHIGTSQLLSVPYALHANSADSITGTIDQLTDADGDTKIEVEKTIDEDTIRFTAGGMQVALLDNKTFHLQAPGGSVFIGKEAGKLDDGTNNYNTAIGIGSLLNNTTGFFNTANGYQTLLTNSTGNNNTANGFQALYSNTTGSENTAIGRYALYSSITGFGNIAVGDQALYSNTTGHNNTANGWGTLSFNTYGNNNTAIGRSALYYNTTGFSNVALGNFALYRNTDRSNLVAIGDSALYNNGTSVTADIHASDNTAVGSKALFTNTNGFRNTATGFHAMFYNAEGQENTATGYQALYLNRWGRNNTADGYQAMYSMVKGFYNVAIGTQALFSDTIGWNNVAIGRKAMYNNLQGSNNIAIGARSGNNNNGRGNVFIGYEAGYYEEGDSTLYIDNGSTTSPLIWGDFKNNEIRIHGNLSVNSSSTDARLVVRAASADEHGLRVRIGSSTKLLLHSNGGLKIGSNGTPLSNGITISGNAEKPGGGSWASSSDRRLKKDITDYTDGLQTLLQIRPVRYYYTEASGLPSNTEYIGVVAQELQKIAPYMVFSSDDNFLKVDFSATTYMLINATKQRQEVIEKVQKTLQQQQKLIEKILQENAVLTARIKEIETGEAYSNNE